MEEQQRLEIADRIRALRQRSPFTQPNIAERLGIGLRAYQKLEKEGTTRYERCEALAEIHRSWAERDEAWSHVSGPWLWDGKERPTGALDLLKVLSLRQSKPSEVEGETLEDLPDDPAELLKRILQELLFLQIEIATIPTLLQEISETMKPIGTELEAFRQEVG